MERNGNHKRRKVCVRPKRNKSYQKTTTFAGGNKRTWQPSTMTVNKTIENTVSFNPEWRKRLILVHGRQRRRHWCPDELKWVCSASFDYIGHQDTNVQFCPDSANYKMLDAALREAPGRPRYRRTWSGSDVDEVPRCRRTVKRVWRWRGPQVSTYCEVGLTLTRSRFHPRWSN